MNYINSEYFILTIILYTFYRYTFNNCNIIKKK